MSEETKVTTNTDEQRELDKTGGEGPNMVKDVSITKPDKHKDSGGGNDPGNAPKHTPPKK